MVLDHSLTVRQFQHNDLSNLQLIQSYCCAFLVQFLGTEAESGHQVSCSDFTFTDHFSRFAFTFHLQVHIHVSSSLFTIHAWILAFVISHPALILRRRSVCGFQPSSLAFPLAGWRSAHSHGFGFADRCILPAHDWQRLSSVRRRRKWSQTSQI